ncbi:MAG: alpha/beta fold hydrolase [Pseudomonadota bacterium]
MRAPDGTTYELNGPEDGARVVLIHGLGLLRRMWDPHVERFVAPRREPVPCDQHGTRPPAPMGGRIATDQAAAASDVGGAINLVEPAGRSGPPRAAAHLSDERRGSGYRVLSYDLYGHGESGPPPETPSLTVYSEQLRGLMDHVGWDAAHIVGFSLGGMINRRFAIDHPERAFSLAILASPHERGEAAQELVEQRARDSAQGPAATLDAAIERWFAPGFRAANPDYINQVREWVLANDPANYAACRWVLANGVRELIRPEPPITHPTLVMTAEHDSGSTPAMTRAIASEIAGAKTIIVPDLQHMGLVEDVAAFTDPIIDFLETL